MIKKVLVMLTTLSSIVLWPFRWGPKKNLYHRITTTSPIHPKTRNKQTVGVPDIMGLRGCTLENRR